MGQAQSLAQQRLSLPPQAPLEGYVFDFLCKKHKLIVEVDAIVGNVETGGGAPKPKDHSYANAITHAPEQEMRSALAEDRETMRERSDEER